MGHRVDASAPGRRPHPGAGPARLLTAGSTLRVADYRIDDLVGDVVALADRAGLDRFHLVGHDWGGAVAWSLAALHPELIETLTVLSTPHPRAFAASMTRSLQAFRSWYAASWQIPVVPEWVMLAGDGRLLRTALVRSGLEPEIADTYVERMREPGALTAALNWYRATGRSLGRFSQVGDVQAPTLYVWSSDDAALGRTAAELTASHVTGPYRFEVLDGVSHWIPEMEPDATAKLVLSQIGSGAR